MSPAHLQAPNNDFLISHLVSILDASASISPQQIYRPRDYPRRRVATATEPAGYLELKVIGNGAVQ